MWKYVAGAAAAVALIVLFVTLAHGREDRSTAASALLALEEAPAGDGAALESAYAKARAQIALIRSSSAREQATSLVDAAYAKKRESLAEVKAVTFEALALISADHESLSALRSARQRAEELAGKLPSATDVAALMAQISEIYDAKRRIIEGRMAAQQASEFSAQAKADDRQQHAAEIAAWIDAERKARAAPVATPDIYCCCSRKLNAVGGDQWIHQWVLVGDCGSSYRRGFETYYGGVCGERSYCGQ